MTDPSTCFPAIPQHLAPWVTGGPAPTERHRIALEAVAQWLIQRINQGLEADVIMVCTGNSRRSILGSTMGNLAAAYLGLPVRFFSGGTEPSAFNPRTIRALQAIGVEITATGQNAASGPHGDPNPIYTVTWGPGPDQSVTEFSKRYDNPANPQSNFAAIMVCTDAEQNCPLVAGASLRVGLPFDDPKEFDGLPIEATQYAARRDQIGCTLFQMLQSVANRRG